MSYKLLESFDHIDDMAEISESSSSAHRTPSREGLLNGTQLKSPISGISEQIESAPSQQYRVYKRRFGGLFALVVLNIVVSWDWLTYAAVSTTASQFYNVSVSDINWLSTAFLLAFVAAAPFTIYVMNRHGAREAIMIAAAFVLVGNWIRYGAARASPPNYGATMFGQILIGFAQPFVLATPTAFANTWFSDKGRVTAIAVASLANPLGAAVGELIAPIWAANVAGMSDMVLYTAIVSTVGCIPAPFVSKAPPTPPSAVAAAVKLDARAALRSLPKNGNFWLIFISFSAFVAAFNSTSTLVNQIFEPYGFSELDAGIAGGLLIIVGIVAAAITSPIIDRTKAYVLIIRIFVPCAALSFFVLIFMPQTRTVVGPYVVCSLIGAFCFSLLPAALETLAIATHPIPPEFSSIIAWIGGQLIGAIMIIVMTALVAPSGWDGQPPGTMIRALIFQSVVLWAMVPLPFLIGAWRFKRIVVYDGSHPEDY